MANEKLGALQDLVNEAESLESDINAMQKGLDGLADITYIQIDFVNGRVLYKHGATVDWLHPTCLHGLIDDMVKRLPAYLHEQLLAKQQNTQQRLDRMLKGVTITDMAEQDVADALDEFAATGNMADFRKKHEVEGLDW